MHSKGARLDGRQYEAIRPKGLFPRAASLLRCKAYELNRRRRGMSGYSSTVRPYTLARALLALNTSGQIEYTGEFGAEVTTFIPFVMWLKREGLLAGRRVITYRGMRPYYYFLDDVDYAEKEAKRRWLPVEERAWPSASTYTALRCPWHVYPDYRTHYRLRGETFARPTLFIQNKFSVEWKKGPLNFITLDVLERIFSELGARFDIIYSRPRELENTPGFVGDRTEICSYPDLDLARRFANVLVLEDYCAATGTPYNQTKLEILAKTHIFIAVQGGGAHLLACFGNSVLLLLHREGEEYPHAYERGPYKYLADPAPALLLARTHKRMLKGVGLLEQIDMTEGSPRLPRDLLSAFSSLRV